MTQLETEIIASLQRRGYNLQCDKAAQMQHYITYRACLQSLCGALLNAMASVAHFFPPTNVLSPVCAFMLPTHLFWQTEPALDLIFEHIPSQGYVDSLAAEIRSSNIDLTKMQPHLRMLRMCTASTGRDWAPLRFASLIRANVLYLSYDSVEVAVVLQGSVQETSRLLRESYDQCPSLHEGAAYYNGYVCDEFGANVDTGELDLLGQQREANVEQDVATHFFLRKLRYLAQQ